MLVETDGGGSDPRLLRTAQWQRLRAWYLANCGDQCAGCGHPVDKTLSGRHPWGPTVDHRVPRSRGGDPFDINNLSLMHLRCNSAKKNKVKTRKRVTSQVW